MTDRLHVDPVSLEGIADQLLRAGQSLGTTAAGLPGTPDAGMDTPIFNDLLVRLTRSATGLAEGLGAAASRVTEAGQAYAAEDAGNAQSINGGR
ncbi:hypothetical protein AB0G04_22515 [Actinoplanes sp. NPDC023801]|uniref:hypothetical protein n=1 Tax=Actinoplanes sp. NPDC023801 TaxID=3154595 RepID=UPI0033C25C05